MEGTTASVPPQGGRKHPQQEFLQVDTTNILFICGGAFSGLEKIIDSREKDTSIGFESKLRIHNKDEKTNLLNKVESEDFLKFGLIPEFIGRLPVVAVLQNLSKDSLVEILTIPKNSLVKQYQKLFEMENVKLSFTKDALLSIAEYSIIKKTGARGLRSILENILLDTMYKLPVLDELEEVVVNADVVKNNKEPYQIFSNKKNKVDTSA
jgi:ATP-dependent Clp protease ATP-binding subunit ClpX